MRFEYRRHEALLEKNKAASAAIELEKKSDELKERSEKLNEGISRIPNDLPEELQQQIDAVCNAKKAEVRSEARDLDNKAYDAQADADMALEKMRQDGRDLQHKGENMSDLKDVPLIGSFADAKGRELRNNGEQLFDIAKETQGYSDRLAKSRNKLRGI